MVNLGLNMGEIYVGWIFIIQSTNPPQKMDGTADND